MIAVAASAACDQGITNWPQAFALSAVVLAAFGFMGFLLWVLFKIFAAVLP